MHEQRKLSIQFQKKANTIKLNSVTKERTNEEGLMNHRKKEEKERKKSWGGGGGGEKEKKH